VQGILTSGILFVAVLLQSSILPMISVWGQSIDLLLILVVVHALLFGLYEGAVIGFFAGLLEDLLAGGVFGLALLPKFFLGAAFGLLHRRVFKENPFVPVSACFVASVLAGVFGILWLQLNGIDAALGNVLYRVLPRAVLTCLAALPVHWLLLYLYKRIG